MLTEQAIFQIDELDCAEEELQLRAEFEAVPAIVDLQFDVLAGTMRVTYRLNGTSRAELLERIERLGMHGRVISERQADGGGAVESHRSGRTWLTVFSGLLLSAGLGSEHLMGAPGAALVGYVLSVVCGTWYVLPRAWSSLRRLRFDMNLLMLVAVVGAGCIGQWSEAASVAFLFSLAVMLEHWSLGRARRAIASLINAAPATARRVNAAGEQEEVEVQQVVPGQVVLVRPGEQIPLDGAVVRGRSEVNEAPITGESKPSAKQPGSGVFAGTINGGAVLEIEVTRNADDTALARIIHMVEEAQTRRAPAEQWIERFARRYTPSMMALALLVAVAPPLVSTVHWSNSIYSALVLLVIACPCALVISTPVTIVSALTSAARRGVLIKGGRYLEEAASVRAVALDKTGTLTLGQVAVGEIIPLGDHSRREVLQRAAALETHSTHPIAVAILQQARLEQVDVPAVEHYRNLPGLGAEAVIDGQPFWIGNHRLWTDRALDDAAARVESRRLQAGGNSVVAVGNAEHICGLIGTSDQIRPAAGTLLQRFGDLGIDTIVMVTGDNDAAARSVADRVGIESVEAELLPADKARVVDKLRHRYQHVAMVGDGVNDAPALATATLGVAMAAVGSDAAIETADVALMSDELARLPWLIRHGRRALSIVKQNVAFALGTKLLFLALALAGMATLWMAIAADTGASLLVIFNGMRMLRTRPDPAESDRIMHRAPAAHEVAT